MQQKQNYNKNESYRNLKLILGNQTVKKLNNITILLVGVGGIGCEILKNLTKMQLKKLVIIDLDTIETSNLNRQFYFRSQHVGKSKSFIAAEEIKKLLPQISIQPLYGNIYDNLYNNYRFYSQFDYVISALDSIKARQFLAQKCIEYDKVMIDAGTAGMYGQSYMSVRFLTSCHNCHPIGNKQDQNNNAAVCTIRSKPEKSLHCAVYAKFIYEYLFTMTQQKDNFSENGQFFLNKIKQKLFNQLKTQTINYVQMKNIAIQVFDFLFSKQFQQLEQLRKQQIKMLTYQQAIKIEDKSNEGSRLNQDDFWTISQYAKQFRQSFINLFHKIKQKMQQKPSHKESQLSLPYDKDDRDCNTFICCISNLRVYNFLISKQEQKYLRYLSLYEVRKIVGKIVPAIASTNSIAAALEVKQIVEFISSKLQQTIEPKYYTISPVTDHKVSYCWLSLPNPQCTVCSPLNLYFHIKCDFTLRTFMQFEQFSYRECFSFNRDIYCQNMIIIKNINALKQSPNKKKFLNFKPQLIIEDTLTLQYLPSSKITDLKVKIILIHQKQQQGERNQLQQQSKRKQQKFIILNQRQIQKTLNRLQSYRQQQKVRQKRKLQSIEIEDYDQQYQQHFTEIN